MNKIEEKVQGILGKLKIDDGKQPQEPVSDLAEYKERLKLSKQYSYIRMAVIAVVILAGAFLVKYLFEHHTYSSYRVVDTSSQKDSSVTQYLEMNGNILRYTADGASLSSAADRTLWSDSFQMTAPVVTSFGSAVAIYDQNGTQVMVYDGDGRVGNYTTEYPIVKASVSGSGAVAIVLDNDEETLIQYYATDGSIIATSSTNMRNPGYPVDLSVSEDGTFVAVSYLVTDDDTISTYLAFYNFGDGGQNKEDNLAEGYRFSGVIVPKIQYVNNDTLVAYREDGFTIYRGRQTPEEVRSVTFDEEIISSFGNDDYMGFVFAGDSTEHPFRMEVYRTSGAKVVDQDFDIVYDEVKISDNQIIFNNASQISVFSMKGIEKFTGNLEEGNIYEVLKTGMNRYTVACSEGVLTIKLR